MGVKSMDMALWIGVEVKSYVLKSNGICTDEKKRQFIISVHGELIWRACIRIAKPLPLLSRRKLQMKIIMNTKK